MRRLALIVAVMCSVGFASPAVRAASASPAGRTGLLHLVQAPASGVTSHGASLRQPATSIVADAQAKAPARQTGVALSLGAAPFSPATINGPYTGVEDNATADNNWFAANHATSFTNLRRVTGYFIRADWTPSGYATMVNFYYQGSVFSGPTDALNAWTDGVTHTQSIAGITSTDCSSTLGTGFQCAIMTYEASGTVKYITVQFNQCLAEISAYASDALYSAQNTQIAATLTNIIVAAAGVLQSACGGSPPPTQPTLAPPPTSTPTPTPSPTPTPRPTRTTPPSPTEFNIISLRVEKYKAGADWKQVRPALTDIKVKTKLKFSLYFTVTSGSPSEPLTVHLTLTRGGTRLADQDFANALDSKNPVDTYRDQIGPFTPTAAGTYRAVETLTLGGRTQRTSASFTVVNAAPPPPPPVSFSFDDLHTADGSGHQTKDFKAGQEVKVVYSYTVRNVKTTVHLTVIRTYQFSPSPNVWRPIGHPILESGDTSNGKHHNTVSSVPNPSYKSQRIVVGITIGRSHREKAVLIQIS